MTNPADSKYRREAVSLLTHYFKVSFEKAGLVWKGDNAVEITSAVDNIIDAAVERFVQITEEEARKVRETPQPCIVCARTVVYDGKPKSELAAMHDPQCTLGAQIREVASAESKKVQEPQEE